MKDNIKDAKHWQAGYSPSLPYSAAHWQNGDALAFNVIMPSM